MNLKNVTFIVKERLKSLSFKTGVIVLGVCALCYILSFAQMLLPIPAWMKGVLWTILFGIAKTAQYSALLIIGKEGIARLRRRWRFKSSVDN